MVIDLLLLGPYTRLSCTLIKLNLQLALIPPPLFTYPIPSYWMNKLTKELSPCQQPKWRQFFPCHNIHVYQYSQEWYGGNPIAKCRICKIFKIIRCECTLVPLITTIRSNLDARDYGENINMTLSVCLSVTQKYHLIVCELLRS